MITLDEYKKHLLGFNILDCTVRSKDMFCFAAQQSYTKQPGWDESQEPPPDDELEKRVIPFTRTRPPGKQWVAARLNGYNSLSIGFSPVPLKPQVVAASSPGRVYVIGSGEAYVEQIRSYHDNGPNRGSITKLKTVGQHVYACGRGRTVARRDGRDDWFNHSAQLPIGLRGEEAGFEDIDGFSEDDLYAVGGEGDVWRFDGKTWRSCAFPSNLLLMTVCCGGDGSVYVSGLYGNIFKGRGDKWKLIHEGNMTIPFNDMVWHDGQVWCTSDYGLWVIEDDQLKEAPVSSGVKICSGNLSAYDGVLLVAGHGGASFYQDGQWHVIFHHGSMTDAASK